jgi:hypothetical protein
VGVINTPVLTSYVTLGHFSVMPETARNSGNHSVCVHSAFQEPDTALSFDISHPACCMAKWDELDAFLCLATSLHILKTAGSFWHLLSTPVPREVALVSFTCLHASFPHVIGPWWGHYPNLCPSKNFPQVWKTGSGELHSRGSRTISCKAWELWHHMFTRAHGERG